MRNPTHKQPLLSDSSSDNEEHYTPPTKAKIDPTLADRVKEVEEKRK